MAPHAGDLLIRTTPGHHEQSEFVIVDPATNRVVAGPFASLAAALNGARSIKRSRGRIWQQILDDRGRPLGPVLRLELHG
jgi:hypothetical protein